jgi:methylenetetrahydrofolate dehydrogenase (NADP+)/methenyltetrahydrofolate cyclohydrolase
MAYIFSGRDYAQIKEEDLRKRSSVLKELGYQPCMVSVQVGKNPESDLFLRLKQKVAKRVGAKLIVKRYHNNVSTNRIIREIESFNNNEDISGVMVQLPMPWRFKEKGREEIISSIDSKKDVDGMRDDSMFVAPVVLAVLDALEEGLNIVRLDIENQSFNIAVVGANGFVGKKIIRALGDIKNEQALFKKFKVKSYDIETKNLAEKTRKAGVLISATGKEGLINKNLVKPGAIVIDVGAPKGDVKKDVVDKASFASLVPGGIGPVTIYHLMENLVTASLLQSNS